MKNILETFSSEDEDLKHHYLLAEWDKPQPAPPPWAKPQPLCDCGEPVHDNLTFLETEGTLGCQSCGMTWTNPPEKRTGWYQVKTKAWDNRTAWDEYHFFCNGRLQATLGQPHIISGVGKNYRCYGQWEVRIHGAEFIGLHSELEAAMDWAEKIVERKLAGKTY